MKKFISLLIAATLMALGVVSLIAGPAQAHRGNISVASAVCVDADTMTATYTVWWDNVPRGVEGSLSTKLGLAGGGGYSFEKNVSGTSGSTTFTKTHEKSAFSGGNGPWVAFKIDFSNGHMIDGDTRVEGFNWNKCTPPDVKDASASVSTTPATCEAPETLVYGDIVNAAFSGTGDGAEGPGSYAVTATADTGHLFADGSKTKVFNGDLAGPLTGQQCAEQPDPEVVQDKDTNCEGVFEREGVQEYVWSEEQGKYVLGEVVWGEWEKVRDLTLDEQVTLGCIKVTEIPAAPEYHDPCGPDNIAWTNIPQDDAALTWTDNDDGSLTVTTNEGYVFPNGSTSQTFSLPEDGNVPCEEEEPEPLEYTDSSEQCVDGDLVSTETVTTGTPVQEEDGTWTYEWSATSSQSIEKDAEQCEKKSTPPPTKDKPVPTVVAAGLPSDGGNDNGLLAGGAFGLGLLMMLGGAVALARGTK